jgi:hypothetical protein
MSRSTTISLSLALFFSVSLAVRPAMSQDAQPKWMSDISNSMNAAASGAPVLDGGQPMHSGGAMPGGAQPKWMSDIGNSMNAAAGTTVVDVGTPPSPAPAPVAEHPEYLGDSIPLTLPNSGQQQSSAAPTFTSPYNTSNMAAPYNTENMNMPFNAGTATSAGNHGDMGMQGHMGMQGGCSGYFHGCCGGNHGQMQQQAQDPCKMFFGMSQQEVGVSAAVAGMLLYPNVVKSMWRSNPQMQTQVSRFLGSGTAAGH